MENYQMNRSGCRPYNLRDDEFLSRSTVANAARDFLQRNEL